MQKAVKEYRADIGIALDGDADRLVICDEKGQVVDGDQIMAIIASDWAKRDKLRGGGVVATVMSNLGLERFLAARKLKLERTQVGDRYVMARMREGGFNVGGEQSGHLILSDFSTTGDGLLAALQVLAVLKEADKPMSALARQFEPAPQKLENVRFASGKPLEDAQVKKVIADAEQRLNGSGRLVIRPSGTEPLIRIMAEGDDEKLVNQLVREIAGAVKKAAA
jgi:phosphoglucosamine mutase